MATVLAESGFLRIFVRAVKAGQRRMGIFHKPFPLIFESKSLISRIFRIDKLLFRKLIDRSTRDVKSVIVDRHPVCT
jgi:hypothetical protein